MQFLFLHLKENSQAQIAEKDYKHPFKNESNAYGFGSTIQC